MQRRYLLRACCALVGLSISVVAHAADKVWDAGGAVPPNGVWGTGTNWAPDGTPGGSDTATFSPSYGDARDFREFLGRNRT